MWWFLNKCFRCKTRKHQITSMAPKNKCWEVHGTWNTKNGCHGLQGSSAPCASVAAWGSLWAEAHWGQREPHEWAVPELLEPHQLWHLEPKLWGFIFYETTTPFLTLKTLYVIHSNRYVQKWNIKMSNTRMNPLSFKKLNISATTLQMFSDFNLPFVDLAWHIPSPHLRRIGVSWIGSETEGGTAHNL